MSSQKVMVERTAKICALLREGLCSADIAERLGLSNQNVLYVIRHHVSPDLKPAKSKIAMARETSMNAIRALASSGLNIAEIGQRIGVSPSHVSVLVSAKNILILGKGHRSVMPKHTMRVEKTGKRGLRLWVPSPYVRALGLGVGDYVQIILDVKRDRIVLTRAEGSPE